MIWAVKYFLGDRVRVYPHYSAQCRERFLVTATHTQEVVEGMQRRNHAGGAGGGTGGVCCDEGWVGVCVGWGLGGQM